MLNKVQVIGHLGADPEMRYTASGKAVTNFSVASSRKFKGGNGELQEETEWFRVTTWDRLAETCSQYLTKGRLVYVEGRLQTRSYDDKDGIKRYSTEVVAQEVKFLGGGERSESGPRDYSRDIDGGVEPDDLPF